MDVPEQLKAAAIEAAKGRDQVRLDTVRMAISALKYRRIEKKQDLTPEEVLVVLGTLCKQRRESIEQFEKGGRADLVAKEKRELEILLSFLPPQLGRDEIVKKVQEVIAQTGAASIKEMGKVMQVLKKELAGKADGSVLSDVVKGLLK